MERVGGLGLAAGFGLVTWALVLEDWPHSAAIVAVLGGVACALVAITEAWRER